MIRINLLNNRREPIDGLEAAITTSGPSAFINRREIVLGVLFVGLGAGILVLSALSNRAGDGDMTPRFSTRADLPTAPARIPAAEAAISAPGFDAGDRVREAQPSPSATTAPRPGSAPPAGNEPPAAARREAVAGALAVAEVSREPAIVPATPNAAAPRGRVSPASPPAALPEPSSESGVVPDRFSALAVSVRGGALQILATIGGQPAYQMFRLSSPNRVVVDLSGVTLALPASQRQLAPSHPLVERVRIAQFQVSPPKVRMVFDVPEFPEIAVSRTPHGLVFQVAASEP